MDFSLGENQELFRDALHGMLSASYPTTRLRAAWHGNAEDHDAPGLWRALAELGCTGLTVPEACDGLGMGPLEWFPLLEVSGYFGVAAPLLETLAVGVPLLAEVIDVGAVAGWLKAVASGDMEVTVTLAHDESVAWCTPRGLVVLGRGDRIFATLGSDLPGLAQEVVDRTRPIRTVGEPGPHAVLLAEGERADALHSAAFERGALGASAQLLGLARRMLDMAVEYSRVRHQFGRPIGSFQAVQHQLADALLALEFAGPVVARAAWSLAEGMPNADVYVSHARLSARYAAEVCARKSLQCHGAIGYATEHDLHFFMKRAWALQRAWRSDAWHRGRIAQAILQGRVDPGGL